METNPHRTPLKRLESIGFVKRGAWQLVDRQIRCRLDLHVSTKNVLYAFVSVEDVLHIGKTAQPLTQRMHGYENPGPTQATNNRVNRLIKVFLSGKHSIEIFALPDTGLLHYGGFHVNLAAGLEDSLIATLKPAWNDRGARRSSRAKGSRRR